MISVAEARERILARAIAAQPKTAPLQHARGLVLAQPIACLLDSPPHDKAQVDGYAVRAADVSKPGTLLRILEQVTAGQVPVQTVSAATATRIMTGAPIPAGADAVVMVERTDARPGTGASDWGMVQINEAPRVGQNIMRQGESMRIGEIVLQPGHTIRSIEIGLLAELGVAAVPVIPRPTVSVISTGDELVPANEMPRAGQIRNSNGPMLEALVSESGSCPVTHGIVRDSLADLTAAIRCGLDSDVLILSGGVSAGVLDLVPQVLQQLEVEQVFHRVRLKPGKPMWFGIRRRETCAHLVFGLPGNPVSSLVCFHLFVRPALAKLAGKVHDSSTVVAAELSQPFQHRSDRPTYLPGVLSRTPRGLAVEPVRWRGSSDLRSLANADALLCLPPGECEWPAGSTIDVLPL